MEVGAGQAAAVAELVRAAGCAGRGDACATWPGIERVVVAPMTLAPWTPTTFARCIAGGGVAVFPADTVYGLACDPTNGEAVARLYALKGRPPTKPGAVMFFDARPGARRAARARPPHARRCWRALLPGGVTLLLPTPRGRFPLACGAGPAHARAARAPPPSARWPR